MKLCDNHSQTGYSFFFLYVYNTIWTYYAAESFMTPKRYTKSNSMIVCFLSLPRSPHKTIQTVEPKWLKACIFDFSASTLLRSVSFCLFRQWAGLADRNPPSVFCVTPQLSAIRSGPFSCGTTGLDVSSPYRCVCNISVCQCPARPAALYH